MVTLNVSKLSVPFLFYEVSFIKYILSYINKNYNLHTSLIIWLVINKPATAGT